MQIIPPELRDKLLTQANDPNESPQRRADAETLYHFSDPAATAQRIAKIHAEARKMIDELPPRRSARAAFVEAMRENSDATYAKAESLAAKEYFVEFQKKAVAYLLWIETHRLQDKNGLDICNGDVVGFIDSKTQQIAGKVRVSYDGKQMTTVNESDFVFYTFSTSDPEQIRSFCSGFCVLGK